MPSRDILDRLLDVEKKADEIVASATGEAESRIAAAKSEAEARLKALLEAELGRLETALDRDMAESDEGLRQELSDFRTRLEALPSGGPAFDRICADFLDGRS